MKRGQFPAWIEFDDASLLNHFAAKLLRKHADADS